MSRKIGRNELCHCGSGKKFKKCHGVASQPSTAPIPPPPSEGERLQDFYKVFNSKLSKCLDPSMRCDGKAIRAHSIQNARSLDLLVENGHVIAVRPDFKSGRPEIVFDRIGRNNASTFAGMCAQHDADIFRPLDTKPFDHADKEQLFLLAYRSATRELYAVIDGAVKIQSAYQDRVKNGLDRGDVPTPLGVTATMHLVRAFEAYRYRATYYDLNLAKSQFDALVHDVFYLPEQPATVAASSLFSLPGLSRGDELVMCSLNVFPVSANETAVVASYAQPDAELARAFLDPILKGDDSTRRIELSRLILRRTDNFVLSPVFYDRWSPEKKEAVIEAFISTLGNDNDVPDDPRLALF